MDRRIEIVWALGLGALAGCTILLPGTDRADAAADTAPTDSGTPDVPVGDVGVVDAPVTDAGSRDASVDGSIDASAVDAAVDGCVNPTGLGGSTCFACTATSPDQFLNHCTTAQCTPFDARMLPSFDGGVPPLPLVDGGASDASADASTDVVADASDGGIPLCSSLTGGHVVYATGSTAATLFLGQVAQALENTASPVTVVYQSSGSCVGVAAMLNPGSNRLTGTATYWNPMTSVDPTSAAGQLTCNIDPGGVQADVGASDVFVTTCQDLPGGLTSVGLTDVRGPIEVMNFVAPQNSTQETISAEAAYLVYGFGAMSFAAMPWTSPSQIFQRGSTSGTQALLAAVIGVPRTQWAGTVESTSSEMAAALVAAGGRGLPVATSTIGILSSDYADRNRTQIHVLGYQDADQHCAMWPDSVPTSLDKRNVRDGHYPLFGPLHLIARIDSSGSIVNAGVQSLLNVITGVTTLGDVDLIHIYATNGLVPACAMQVARDSDEGAVHASPPAVNCGCYFEEQATGLVPPPGCTPCNVAGDCADAGLANCNRFGTETQGYCEP